MGHSDDEQAWLRNYLQGFLWADDDWLEVDGSAATYWQARLAQTTTITSLPDGRVKWRVRTRVVERVTRGAEAPLLCLALNRYSAGWSFAYDANEQAIDALVAVCAPPAWDMFVLRLSEKAKLSAWMSDVIAQRLADAVGGRPAYNHPERQPGVRESFDGTYYYSESLRGRPEWVLNLTRYGFPSLEEVGAQIAGMVGAGTEQIKVDDGDLRIPIGQNRGGIPVHLHGGFGEHPIVGDGWGSSLVLPMGELTASIVSEVSAITWALFDGHDASLLGSWTYDSGQLIFQQWNTMSEVRNQEQLGSYAGHRAEDLWGFTSTLSDALGAVMGAELVSGAEPDVDSVIGQAAEHVIAAIAEQARAALQHTPQESDSHADRRLLWMQRRKIREVAVWFNPMGPTVGSIEVCALPDGAEYVVYFRRHPFAPFYCVLGPVPSDSDTARFDTAAAKLLLSGSLPNVLVEWSQLNVAVTDVPSALRGLVIETAAAKGVDLHAEAAWLSETLGNPWNYAAVDPTAGDQVRDAALKSPATNPDDQGFGEWWEQVSKVENVLTNFRCLPDAWDGAINTQRSFGNLAHFDVGPLAITYSTIGMAQR